MITLVMATNDAHRALKRLASQPQFAVQGLAGQPGRELYFFNALYQRGRAEHSEKYEKFASWSPLNATV
jgi:hypothetical protein